MNLSASTSVQHRTPRGGGGCSPVAFAVVVGALGWLLSTVITYTLFAAGELGELWFHEYIDVLCLVLSVGGIGALAAMSVRLATRPGRLGTWASSGGLLGSRKQMAFVTAVPTAVFLAAEYVERYALNLLDAPPVSLIVAGVILQALVGLLSLVVSRGLLRVVERVLCAVFAYINSRASNDHAFVDAAELAPTSVHQRQSAGRGPPRAIAA